MKREVISALITARAQAFGLRNPQQRRQIESRLHKADPLEVQQGLLHIFTHGAPPPGGSGAQELAGHLLLALRPTGPIDLETLLRAALPRYELSVEQFPEYLTTVCGHQAVSAALDTLSRNLMSDTEQRAWATLAFWLRQAEHREVKHHAGNI